LKAPPNGDVREAEGIGKERPKAVKKRKVRPEMLAKLSAEEVKRLRLHEGERFGNTTRNVCHVIRDKRWTLRAESEDYLSRNT